MRLGSSENCCSYARAALIPLLLSLVAQYFQSSHGQIVERLSLGSILLANQTLISRNGTFALGIFSLGPPDRNYLGVSYEFSKITHIWVANRNHPAKNGAFLRFSSDGNVAIYNPDQTTVWMSGTSDMSISSMVMEESGNVVLMNQSSGKVIWQSFDHPADTWVPGMNMPLGSNLTSSISTVDIAEGRFSMLMLQTTEFVCMWNNSVQYWTSGVWNGYVFVDVPEMSSQTSLYNYALLNDSGRPYFTWSEKQNVNYSHFTLESDGIIRIRTWDSVNAQWYTIWTEPKDPCQVDHLCGQNGICNSDFVPFCSCPQGFKAVDPTRWSQGDWSLGCVPNFSVNCSSNEFSFLQHTAYDQGSGAGSARAYSGHDQAWCQSQCIDDCACLGFSFDNSRGNCLLEYGPFFNGKNSPDIPQNFFLRVSTTQSLGNKKSSRVWIIGIGVATGCAVLLLIALLLRQILFRKRVADKQPSKYISGILKKFSYKEIRTATNNFNEKIGAGGFGSVYKGCLRDQTKVAVKKLHNMKQGDKDFRAEVSTLGMIQHVNLVRLRGFCADDEHRLLVYDYMPNGSLNSFLFSKTGAQQQVTLDWDTRFSIALGTARGITYLHEECMKCIIHCDIKPENILLDSNFCAKVSDFGLAKLMGREFSRVITSMRGTRGYLAPEWLSSLPVTAKADVYSYGMTLLEIVSGRRNIDANTILDNWFFPLWACQRARLGDFSSLADSKLCGNFNEGQLKKAVLVALWCIQDEETSRPTMGRVVQMLEGTLEVTEAPFPKSLLSLEVDKTHSPLDLSVLTFDREKGDNQYSTQQTNSMDLS